MRPPVRTIHRKLVAAAWILAIGLLTTSARAATINVTTTDDESNSDGDCSLREAIASANGDVALDTCTAGSGTDTINLLAGTYTAAAGLGQITTSLSLVGAGVGSTILTGSSGGSYLFARGGSVTLRDLTLFGAASAGSTLEVDGGTLTLQSVLIDSDGAGGHTIECRAPGNIAIIDSEVRNCTSGSNVITFSGNTLTVSRSLFRQNAGAISMASGTATFENTTFSGNSHPGSFVYVNTATASMSSCTVYGNVANAILDNNAGTFSIKSTIVAGNTSGGGDLAGAFTSGGNNIISNVGSGTGFGAGELNYPGYSLPALANNGGPTFTHLPAAGNAAINNGSCTNVAGAAVTVDQRSVARPASNCDVGAVEAAAVASIPTLSEWGMILLFFGIATTLAVSATRRLNETPTPQC